MPPPQASPANSPADPHNSQSSPPSLPPKPPSYQDPNFIATSVAKHISLADIQASRGSASTIYDAFTPAPYTQPPSFNAVPPQFVQEQLSTGTTPAQYRSPSPFSFSEPQSQYQGSTAYPSTIPSQPTPTPSYRSTQTQWSNEQTYQRGKTAEHTGGGERRGGARQAGGVTNLSWESQPASEANTVRETPRSNFGGRNISAQATPTASFQNWDDWNRY